MAANRTTRRGNGAGWGGPAKGKSTSRVTTGGDEYSDAVRALAHDPKHAEAKAPLRELALKTWVDVCLNSEGDGYRVAAAEKIMDRIDGRAAADVTSGGQPIANFSIITGVERAGD